ncbi:MAG: ABC transporter ATP-binding protein [Rhodocyclaceae bacterium]|uniref:ABC transporter ATP-binding protein/permease n=1 Tax=Candidatus Desulfobacillus denitrificans TaxID=2608985 RepID=A0A809QZ51_9PROT|nr:ABC transporter ATP-binding protein/permease [Candidatus Desulfobacillus denitrificans]GIK44261.1 MAG: ABC transporter ATP-binding protein [Betaproteobacteria bacterium]GJQ55228.1 MAG: ABC transporter ATP-binding protein [Rhodocyclaceae bacterium]
MKIVDRHPLQRFWAVATPYWRQERKWQAWGMLALLVLLLVGQTRFAVLFNEQTGEFTSALAAREEERFWAAIRYCLGLLLFAVPVYAFYYFVRDKLGLLWRRWMTDRFLDSYFERRHYYELNANAAIDNPDQRISEDINTFTQRTLYFLLILIGALMQLFAFSLVLWEISRALVYFLVVYAIFGTAVTLAVFGKPLLGLNFMQLKREADFRFGMVRIREHAESIAFYRGEAQESQQVRRRFAAAFDNYNRLIRSQLFLNLFQYAYGLLTIVLPSALIAGDVLSGELEVGAAVQAAGAFAAVLSAISVVIENFEGLSRFAAGIDRLNAFARVLAAEPACRAGSPSLIESVPGDHLALEQVTLLTPGGERTLVKNLSLAVAPGEGLLIVGESGSGKSSLLRAIAGLWYCGSGRVVRPPAEDLLFLPQKPYMILGTLRSQLLYPQQERPLPDAELLRLLERVNLPDVAERFGGLDAERDWEKVLSIGEQQRLAFARVLLTRPRYAILDEATSALDAANEESLYRQLAATETTLVSVAHRPALHKYHRQVLELAGDGDWQLRPL